MVPADVVERRLNSLEGSLVPEVAVELSCMIGVGASKKATAVGLMDEACSDSCAWSAIMHEEQCW